MPGSDRISLHGEMYYSPFPPRILFLHCTRPSQNGGETTVTYYVLRFRPRTPLNKERGINAGGSFMIDWNDVAMVENEKGGRRQIIDRATTMFGRFEMHVTTLNKGLSAMRRTSIRRKK